MLVRAKETNKTLDDNSCEEKYIAVKAGKDGKKDFITACTIESAEQNNGEVTKGNYLLKSYNLELSYLKSNIIMKKDKKGNTVRVEPHYYVCGPGWEYNISEFNINKNKEVPVNENYQEKSLLEIEISKELYDVLFKANNKQIPVEKTFTDIYYND